MRSELSSPLTSLSSSEDPEASASEGPTHLRDIDDFIAVQVRSLILSPIL